MSRLSKISDSIDPELAKLPLEQLLERTSSNDPADALPAYTLTPEAPPSQSETPHPDITAAFAALNLTNEPLRLPTADTCLAHLKLLYAFRNLKDDIGYTDGLWGINDY
jgi:hypothetical protein